MSKERETRPFVEDRQFEVAIEDLRLQAFRIYESVRAVQREREAPSGERTRGLSIAASLALQLVEDVRRITWDLAAIGAGDPIPAEAGSNGRYRAIEFARSAS